MKTPFCFLIAAMLFASCSNDESVPTAQTPPENPYKVTPEEAKNAVMEFLDAFDQSDLTRSSSPRNILNIKALRNYAASTRSTLGENTLDLDTLMYVVNFSDSAGYALVAADKRTTPILAIIESGNYDFSNLDQEENEGFLMFLEQAIDRTEADIREYDETQETVNTRATTSKGWTLSSRVHPILKTKWGQGNAYEQNSYGKYCPNKVAGCTPIAIVQIMSHYQTIKQFSWTGDNNTVHNVTINWDRVMQDNQNRGGKLNAHYTPESMNEIAHLARYVGIKTNAKYRFDNDVLKNSTGVDPDDAVKWLNKHSGLIAKDWEYYNESKIIDAIKGGDPVFALGYSHKTKAWIKKRRYKNGHAWVYDGYVTAEKNGKKHNMVHCNWGWNGRSNGFYIGHIFDTNVGPEVYETELTRAKGTDYYYCFKLNYSILKKR